MFSVVEVSGPVFYQDWSGRRVEIRSGDSLSKDDLISSLSEQDIKLETLSNTFLTLQTGTPTSVENLISQSASNTKKTEHKQSPKLETIVEHTFKGSVIEDDGIGAMGELRLLSSAYQVPAIVSRGKFGILRVSESGAWLYHLSDEAMDGALTAHSERAEESFSLTLVSDGASLTLSLTIDLQGTDDIPDILDARLALPSTRETVQHIDSANRKAYKKASAEHELMSMIGDLLMTNSSSMQVSF